MSALQYDKVTYQVIDQEMTRHLTYREVWEVFGPKPFYKIVDEPPIAMDYGDRADIVAFLIQMVRKEDEQRRRNMVSGT